MTYEAKGKEEKVVSSDILMAVGRAPRVDGLNLEAAGVNYTPRGIQVDDNMRTNVEGIYAIGGVNARMMLAHVASFRGERFLTLSTASLTTSDLILSLLLCSLCPNVAWLEKQKSSARPKASQP